MYKLVFRGKLVEGAVRADVVVKLALILKQDPERIKQLMFAGKECFVKRVDDAALAAKWVNVFAKAGAVLNVIEEADVESLSNNTAVDELASSVSEVPSAKSTTEQVTSVYSSKPSLHQKIPTPKRRWLLGGLGVFLAIAVASAVVWQQGYLNRWLFASLDQDEKTLLAALADPQLLAIARVNVELIRTLDPSLADSEQLQNLPGVDADIWSSLERAGISIPQQAMQLYAIAFAGDAIEVAFVLRGTFSDAKARQWIDERYGIEKQDADGIWFAPINKTNCTKGEFKLAQLSQQQLLIGSPEAVKRIARRLSNAAVAEVDISRWQNVLAGKVFSAAVFSPARWQTAEAGLVQHALSKLAAEMESVTEVYFDLEPDVVAHGMNAHLSLISPDQKYIDETHAALKTGLSETRQKIAQDWPEVSAIYDRLQLNHTTEQLQLSIRFDHKIKEEVASWFRSLFSFSTAIDQSGAAPQEVIEENRATFGAAGTGQLNAFAPQNDFIDSSYQTIAGPFGVGVEALTLNDHRVQVKLGVKAYDLPNLGNESSPAFLVVTDVVDHQGNSLLSTPACGEIDQRLPEPIKNSYATRRFENGESVAGRALIGTKNIALAPGINFAQIARITGYIDYRLPVSVDKKIVDAPLAGKTIDLHGTRIRFKSTAPSGLNFEYSGKVDQLLQVSALNAQAKPLSSSSGTRSGLFFGSGKSVSLDFKGTVAKAEVIVASAIENQRYDFELTQIAPPGKVFFMEHSFPERISDKDFLVLDSTPAPLVNEFPYSPPKAFVSEAPFVFALYKARTSRSFGLNLDGVILVGNNLPLHAHIGAAQLRVNKIQDAAGQEHSVNKTVPLYFQRYGGMTINGIYEADEKTPWLKADFSLGAEKIHVENVSLVSGEILFFKPKSVRSESVPFSLGEVWSGVKSSLVLNEWQHGKLIFNVQESYEEIVGLKAFNADGDLISQPPEYSAVFGEPKLSVQIRDLPARLEIDVAENSEALVVPFEVIVSEQD
jgi:hypothetical protein